MSENIFVPERDFAKVNTSPIIVIKGDYEEVRFDLPGDFAAVRAAEAWCKERGISVGSMQAHSPRGLLYGDYKISKWRGMTLKERAALDGTMEGGKFGPVTVRIRKR